MNSLREDVELLRDRPFARLLAARTIASFGGAFAPVALAFGVLRLPGATPKTLSIVLTCESVPMLVFLLIGGVIADRFRRQRVIVVGELLGAVAFSGLAILLGSGFAPLGLMGMCSAASGIGLAVLWPAISGMIPEIVPADQLEAGNALLSMSVNISRVAGLVTSGFVVAWAGASWALGFTALMLTVGAGLVFGLRTRTSQGAGGGQASSVFQDLKDGWTEFTKHQWLWVVVLQFSLLVCVFSAAHGVFGPVLAKQELGGAKAWSWILAGEAVGMLVGVLIAMRIKPRRPIRAAVLATIPTIPLPWLLLGLHAPLALVICGSFLMGAAFDFFGVLWNSTMQREVPPEALSRVSSYDALGSMMFGPIGLLLAGPVASMVDVHKALLGCGVLLFVIAVLPLLSPSVRTVQRRDDTVGTTVELPRLPEEML